MHLSTAMQGQHPACSAMVGLSVLAPQRLQNAQQVLTLVTVAVAAATVTWDLTV